jgi:hypothetical protein
MNFFPATMLTALLAAIAGPVAAQAGGAHLPQGRAASAASARDCSPTAGPLGYRSAFDCYRPFVDQAREPWREANDLVGRIGGWQAYTREGQGGAPATPPQASSAPATPASAAGGHSGPKHP